MPDFPLVSLIERRRHPDLWPRRARDRSRASCWQDHLDITVLIAARRTDRAAARHRVSGGEGHDPRRARAISAPSSLRSTTTRTPRRLRAARCRSARRATARPRAAISSSISPAARRCFPRTICATAICAPIRAIPRRCCSAVLKARDLVGTFDKPRYITFYRRPLRAFALEDRRLPPLSRPVPDRRDHARRRSCRDRSATSARAAASAPPCARPAPPRYALPRADALMRKLRTLLHDLSRGGRRSAPSAAA